MLTAAVDDTVITENHITIHKETVIMVLPKTTIIYRHNTLLYLQDIIIDKNDRFRV